MNTTPKHTKGPWTVGHWMLDAHDGRQPLSRGQFNLFPIPQDSEAEANARLIAAAPDLLRELKSAIFYIETYGGAVTANFAAGGNLTAVKTIIDKAEGK